MKKTTSINAGFNEMTYRIFIYGKWFFPQTSSIFKGCLRFQVAKKQSNNQNISSTNHGLHPIIVKSCTCIHKFLDFLMPKISLPIFRKKGRVNNGESIIGSGCLVASLSSWTLALLDPPWFPPKGKGWMEVVQGPIWTPMKTGWWLNQPI